MASNLSGDLNHSTENDRSVYSFMSRIWRFAMIALLAIGVCFRFANLDHKVYWFDEVSTSIRVAGHTKSEVEQQFVSRGAVTAQSLLEYQTLQADTPWQDTFTALKKSPEQAPFYYLLARLWTQMFGSSVLAIRSLSAFISLLALPCIYWLGLELFRDPRPGWILVMLLSVSPFYVAYAQEARPYSLWTATILLSSIACLRARRLNTMRSWVWVAIATTLSFYTSLLSLFITIGQSLYLLALEKSRSIQIKYLAAVGIASLFFTPWLIIIGSSVKTFQDNTGWMRMPMELSSMVAIWIAPILLTFGDLPFPTAIDPVKTLGIVLLLLALTWVLFLIIKPQIKTQQQIGLLVIGLPAVVSGLLYIGLRAISSRSQVAALDPVATGGLIVAFFIFALVIYAIRFIQSSANSRLWLFPLTLGLTTPLSLMLIDLVQSGQSSANPRYMVPLMMAIQLAVAHLFACKIFEKSPQLIGRSHRWTGVMAFVIGVGLFSCTLNLEKSPIYQKSRNRHNIPIAKILRGVESPLLAEPQATLDLVSLSHSLEPNTQVQPLTENLSLLSNACKAKTQSLYIFNPSPALQVQLQESNSLEAAPIYKPKLLIPSEIALSLWSVKPAEQCIP
ncbi:MAG: glycosyltransferase family 39 protein [Cyanobacteria bacterium P01_A01_bin.17]